jgi:hypothetical protein
MIGHWSTHEVVIADRRERYHGEAAIHAAVRDARKPSRVARLVRLARRRPVTRPAAAPAAVRASGPVPAA